MLAESGKNNLQNLQEHVLQAGNYLCSHTQLHRVAVNKASLHNATLLFLRVETIYREERTFIMHALSLAH